MISSRFDVTYTNTQTHPFFVFLLHLEQESGVRQQRFLPPHRDEEYPFSRDCKPQTSAAIPAATPKT